MICPKCGLELPDESKFCQYCGVSVTASSAEIESSSVVEGRVVDTAPATRSALQSESRIGTFYSPIVSEQNDKIYYSKDPREKATRFCRQCGGKIDNNTKKCTLCGKQYFRVKTTLPIIILTFLLTISISLNIYGGIRIIQLEHSVEIKSQLISAYARRKR